MNVRVNYPIKKVLVDMDNGEIVNTSDEVTKYCVSKVSCDVASYGLKLVIASWNMHPISGENESFLGLFTYDASLKWEEGGLLCSDFFCFLPEILLFFILHGGGGSKI